MKLLFFLLSVVVVLHCAVDVTASEQRRSTVNGTSATILTPDVVKAVQEIADAQGIPGLTLAVVNKTGLAEFGAWGIKSENGTNMTTDTLFNLASCSKAFVSASLGILIDDFAQGRNTIHLPSGLSNLTWKTKLADILPNDWQLMDPWASQKASLIDILSHMSGVGRHDFSFKLNNNVSLSDITRNLRNYRPTFEFREQFSYNNAMYVVGTYIVSTLTGMRYPDFVYSRIFKPLGMTSSTYSIDAALQTGRFTNTWTSFGRLIPPYIEENSVDITAGPGGVISSVEDLVPWVRMILNHGIDPVTNVTIISSTQFDVITSAHSISSPDQGPDFSSAEASTLLYGLGWFRFTLLGYDTTWHDGGAPGVTTAIAATLENGIGIIVLTNADSDNDDTIFDIILKVADKAFSSGNSSSSPSPSPNSSTIVTRRSNPLVPRRAGVTARADQGAPDIDLTGTYFNPGYGTGVLCSVNSSSPSCGSVLDAFRSVDPSLSSNSSSSDLFASWVTVFSTHIRFTHTNDSQYSISAGSIYPHGYGKNTTAFWTHIPIATAEFEVENGKVVGFGWNNLGDDGDVQPQTGSVEETSEVWFVKQA